MSVYNRFLFSLSIALIQLHFVIGQGCPVAYCSPSLSGLQMNAKAPRSDVTLLWNRTDVGGSADGLGCTTNGPTIACTMADTDYGLVLLDQNGNTITKSNEIKGTQGAYKAVPYLIGNGVRVGVVTKDDNYIKLLNTSGFVYWTNYGYARFSPVSTENQRIMFGSTVGGLVAVTTYGLAISELNFHQEIENSTVRFIVSGNPSINGNKVYAITHYKSNISNIDYGCLYSVDVRNAEALRMNITWSFNFKELPINHAVYYYEIQENKNYIIITSDKSIYFIIDLQWNYQLLWSSPLPFHNHNNNLNIVLDSEVGFWIYTNKSSLIYHYNITGDVINKLDLSKLINNCNNCVVTSKVTIVGFISNVTLIVAIGDSSNNYILGIDRETLKLLWKYDLNKIEVVGQLPIVNYHNLKAIVFSSKNNGIFAIGNNNDDDE